MKKTVLALAAIAASSAAFAQSSVTLYGVVDVSVESVKGNTAGKSTTFNRVSSSNLATSRIGFRGVEDLGGGLKANFQLESGLNVDTGSQGNARLFDRAAWVGLSSKEAGEIRLGRHDSLIGAQIASVIGAQAYDVAVVAGTLGDTGSLLRRLDNSITYIAPSFVPGLTLSAQYSTAADSVTAGSSEAVSGSKLGRTYGFAANFVQGPVSAGASYINANSSATLQQENVGLFLYGAYDLGLAKLTAYYNDDTNDGNRRFDGRRLYGIQAAVPVATGLTVTAGYGYARNVGTVVSNTGFAVNPAAPAVIGKNVKNDNAGIINLRAQYDLSKRTAAYALFTQVQNGDNANLGLASVTTTRDKSVRGLAVGVRHSF